MGEEMGTKLVSPFLSFLLQAFFSVIVLAGVCGSWAALIQLEERKRDGDLPNIAYAFLLLAVSLIAVGLRGVIFVRREIEADSDVCRMSLRSPHENVIGGAAMLTLGVVSTVATELWSDLFGDRYIVLYGLVVVGAVHVLVGVSRLAIAKRMETGA